MTHTQRITSLILVTTLTAGLTFSTAWAQSGVDTLAAGGGGDVEMGTDPRDFAPKFMPYYRYTELDNGLEQHELTLFGLFAFNTKFAMTYEIPLAKEVDVKGTDFFQAATGSAGSNPPTFNFSLPSEEADGEETGVGDMNMRFMYSCEQEILGSGVLLGAQFNFPTATDDLLGSEQFQVSPMLALVKDLEFLPMPGAFVAGMNFWFTDLFGESTAEDVSFYLGRYFVMLPLTPPDLGALGGIYLLPEFQPMYDFESDHFSFWAAPEIGKMLSPGNIVYAKPGWGVDPDPGDRSFTFEAGWRWFF